MKYALLFILMAAFAVPGQAQQSIKLSTFTRVPKDMDGCGDVLYFTAKDKKAGRMLCVDNFEDALLMINGKLLRFKPKETPKANILTDPSGRYKLDVQISNKKQEDTEYYTFDAVLTVLDGTKVVFKQKVIGDGGC